MSKKNIWFLCGFAVMFLFSLAFVFLGTNKPVEAAEPIKVYLDGKLLQFDVQPQIINDRTMVPMRVIFEELGATVQWDDATKTITATKGDLVVKTTIGDRNIYVNGVKTTMDVAPVIVNDRTLVPARFVSEALGCEVYWDEKTRTVYIYSSANPDNSDDYHDNGWDDNYTEDYGEW